MSALENIISILSSRKFSLSDEKALQLEIEKILIEHNVTYQREYFLDAKNKPDFYIYSGIIIEVKINKGSKKSIYKQCERYCQFGGISKLILVTNRSMGFPPAINGKDCYVINLGKAWL